MENIILLIILFLCWILFGLVPVIILAIVVKDFKESEDYENEDEEG